MAGRQRETRGIYTGRLEPDPEPGPSRGIAWEIDDLTFGPDLHRQGIPVHRCDDDRKTSFPQLLGENILGPAPLGRDPFRRQQADDRLAAGGGGEEGLLPSLARTTALLRVQIEENIMPSIRLEPIAHPQRCFAIDGRVRNEDPRQQLLLSLRKNKSHAQQGGVPDDSAAKRMNGAFHVMMGS